MQVNLINKYTKNVQQQTLPPEWVIDMQDVLNNSHWFLAITTNPSQGSKMQTEEMSIMYHDIIFILLYFSELVNNNLKSQKHFWELWK
jgi:hypothetical protein